MDSLTAIGAAARTSRRRRRLSQLDVASRVGVSRAYVAKIEGGRARGVSLAVLFSLGEVLGRPFRAEFLRDRLSEPADAGHLAIQELVLRLARQVGYEGRFELATRPVDPSRSSDVALVDRRRGRMILVECWNSFGDLGSAARSSDRKLAEAYARSVTLPGDGRSYVVGLCWVVRDTARNRELILRYPHIFETRFAGSSAAWLRALTQAGPAPAKPGLIWCDAHAQRLFARRRHAAG